MIVLSSWLVQGEPAGNPPTVDRTV